MAEIFRELSQLLVAVIAMIVVAVLAARGAVSGEVAVGFMGTTMGYIFGRSVGSVQTARAVEKVRNGDG